MVIYTLKVCLVLVKLHGTCQLMQNSIFIQIIEMFSSIHRNYSTSNRVVLF